MKKLFFLLTILLLAVAPALVRAGSDQGDGLDSSLGPNFYYGYLPTVADPIIVSMLSGGDVNVSQQGIGSCSGFVTSSPDAQIEVNDSLPLLRAFYTSTQTGGDTTLTVELPNGSFVCNDDFSGLDPLVEISNPDTGIYSFWVGSFNQNEYIPGYLIVTSGASFPGALDAPVLTSLLGGESVVQQPTPDGNLGDMNFGDLFNQSTPTAAPQIPSATPLPPPTIVQATPQIAPTSGGETGGGSLTFDGTPTNGTAILAAGFAPDPNTIDISAGGNVDIRAQGLGDSLCRGFSGSNPDYRVSYAGGGTLLRFFFVSRERRDDTTMLIRMPSGEILCHDDFPGALNPLIDIFSPPAGNYDIWVGVYNPGTPIEGTLYITASTTIDPTTERK